MYFALIIVFKLTSTFNLFSDKKNIGQAFIPTSYVYIRSLCIEETSYPFPASPGNLHDKVFVD